MTLTQHDNNYEFNPDEGATRACATNACRVTLISYTIIRTNLYHPNLIQDRDGAKLTFPM